MTRPAPDWGSVMENVALELMGEPHTRYPDELRYGNHGSLVVNVTGPYAGRWQSWECNSDGGVLDFLRYQLGLDRQEAWRWLQDHHMVDSETPVQKVPAAPRRPQAPIQRPSSEQRKTRDQQRLRNFAQDLWAASVPISTSPEHPARRWMAHRTLWRPELPLPSSVRWIPATIPLFRGLHQGAGSVAVLMAPPEAWGTAWPQLPELAAIHLVSIDADGMPALDRPADHTNREGNLRKGLGKRLYGSTTGTVVVLGHPILTESNAPVRIIEGLADGLALASRFAGPVIAGIGTPGRLAKDTGFVAWLATSPHGTVIHADADVPGEDAARKLRRALQDDGAQVRAVLPEVGLGKDSAEIARHNPFSPLSESWVNYAATLTQMHQTWPRWEVARQASIATAGEHDDQ